MTHESLVNEDWTRVIGRLGGAARLEASARETKAFVRRREIPDAVALLRLVLAYCLGERGLRSTAAWSASVGLADLSSVALFYRLRQCGDWFAVLVEGLLAAATPKASRGRLMRIIDGTTVPKAGPTARKKSELWRIHSAFDLPYERFGYFELTDQQEGETFDRTPVVKGEIRLADRAYLQPDRIAAVLEAGADVVIRAGWKNARWLDVEGRPLDLIAQLRAVKARGLIDRPIWIKRKGGAPGMSDILCKRLPRRLNRSGFLHQPDIVVDLMVANSGRAASSVKAVAAAGGGRRPAFTELAGRPYSGHRIDRLIDTDGSVIFTSFGVSRVIVLIPGSGSRTESRTGP